MPVPRTTLLLLAASILAIPLAAQQTTSTSPAATSDPQAIALLQKSLAAMTGGATITDVTLTGSARRIAGSDDETGTATLEATSAGDSRVELDFASGNRIEIRNHSALPLPGSLPPGVSATAAQTAQPVGQWIGPDGVSHGMAAHNIMTDAAWFFPALTFENILGSQKYALTYLGQETHNGATVLHVRATGQFPQLSTSVSSGHQPPGPPLAEIMQHLSQMDLYFDPNSLLPVALDFTQHPDSNALVDIAVEIRFSEYQATSGATVPTHVQKYLNNGLALDLQFSNATLNSGLSTSTFALQ
jgi:hypothetical protein